MTLPTSEAEVAVQAIREAMADGMLIIAPYLSDPPPDPDAMPEGIDFAVRPLNQWCALLAATAAYFAGEAGYDEATLRQLAPVMRSGAPPADDAAGSDRMGPEAKCVECGAAIWLLDEEAGRWADASGAYGVDDSLGDGGHAHKPAADLSPEDQRAEMLAAADPPTPAEDYEQWHGGDS